MLMRCHCYAFRYYCRRPMLLRFAVFADYLTMLTPLMIFHIVFRCRHAALHAADFRTTPLFTLI